MFGSNNNSGGFGSSFGSSNANTSPFGRTTTGFGSTNTTSSPFGQSSTNNTGSTGAFGSNNSTSAFGSSTPSSFGSTFGRSASATGTSFNSGTSSGGLFGQNKPATSFGGFGSTATNTNQTSTFGSPSSTFGASTLNQPVQGTTIPFEAYSEKDTSPGASHGTLLSFQTITAMPQYLNQSVEELRFQDYQQNRRYGTGATGSTGFGSTNNTSSPFGASNTTTSGGFGGGAFGASSNTPSTGFGSSPFGASNTTNTNTSSPFGQSNTNTGNAFGSSGSAFGSGSSAFGAKPAGSGIFGQSSTTGTGFGSTFGSNNSSSAFGQDANNNQNKFGFGSGGGFGSTNTSNNTTGGLFGANNTTNTSSPFGQNQTNSTSAFGSNNNTNTTNAFGGGFGANKFGASTSNTSSPFGQPQQNNTTGGLFGQNNSTSTGTTGGGLFGGGLNNNTNNNATTGGLFGQNNNTSTGTTGGLFGAKPAATTGGLFGNNNTTNNTASSGGLFGGSSTGGFGANNNNTSTTNNTLGGGGLFGAKPAATTGGLFGNNTANNTASTGTGLFGNNAASTTTGGGLFGNNNNNTTGGFGGASTGGGLFGGNNNNNTAATNTSTGSGFSFGGAAGSKPGGLFGNSATTPNTGGGLFGGGLNNNAQPQQQNTLGGGSLFGGNQAQPQQNAPLIASIDQNPYGANPLFTVTPTATANPVFGPSAAPPLASPDRFKKHSVVSAYKLTPKPLFSPQRRANKSASPGAKLLTNGSAANTSSITSGATTSPNNSLFGSRADDLILSSNAFSPRQSVRRLIIDRKRTSNSFTDSSEDDSHDPNTTANGTKLLADISTTSATQSVPSTPTPTNGAGYDNGNLVSPSKTPLSNGIKSSFVPTRSPLSSTPVAKPAESSAAAASALSSTPATTTASGSAVPPPATAVDASELAPVSAPAPAEPTIPDDEIVNEHGYWMSPSEDKLNHMSLKELRAVPHFKVGRKGCGQIEFLDPVDLSGFKNFSTEIFDRIVVFLPRGCALYPDNIGVEKPPPGQGLNVNTQLSLEGVWALSRDKREPVKDPKHKMYDVHLQRLKKMPNQEFVSFDGPTGTWVFKSKPLV